MATVILLFIMTADWLRLNEIKTPHFFDYVLTSGPATSPQYPDQLTPTGGTD